MTGWMPNETISAGQLLHKKKNPPPTATTTTTATTTGHMRTLYKLWNSLFMKQKERGKKIPLPSPHCIKQWFYSGLQFWLQTMTVWMTEIWPDKLFQRERGYTEGESSACKNKSTGSARFRQLLLDSGANQDVFLFSLEKKCWLIRHWDDEAWVATRMVAFVGLVGVCFE